MGDLATLGGDDELLGAVLGLMGEDNPPSPMEKRLLIEAAIACGRPEAGGDGVVVLLCVDELTGEGRPEDKAGAYAAASKAMETLFGRHVFQVELPSNNAYFHRWLAEAAWVPGGGVAPAAMLLRFTAFALPHLLDVRERVLEAHGGLN